MKKSFHIIGAGRVGQTVARLLQQSGRWRLAQVCGGHKAAMLADRCGGENVPSIRQLSAAEVVWITTPDNVIAEVAAEVARLSWLVPDTLVLHCSGAKSTAELAPLAARGVKTGSLHPVFAFADVEAAVAALPGSLCALEADKGESMAVLQQIASDLNLQPFSLPSEHKARYHAALSAASNFSVALAAYAQNLLEPLGLPEALSRALVAGLMAQSIRNLAALSAEQALTGPIVRGDDGTVAAHLAALSADEQAAYRAWARQTLALAAPRLERDALMKLAVLLYGGKNLL